jgi:hypothetical protein
MKVFLSALQTKPSHTKRFDVLTKPENPAHASNISSGEKFVVHDLTYQRFPLRPELVSEGYRTTGKHTVLLRSRM